MCQLQAVGHAPVILNVLTLLQFRRVLHQGWDCRSTRHYENVKAEFILRFLSHVQALLLPFTLHYYIGPPGAKQVLRQHSLYFGLVYRKEHSLL